MNAGIWLGAAVFFSFWAGPAFFSQETKDLLGVKNFPYFSGALAQIVIARYFNLQVICCFLAVVHVLGEWLYCARSPRRLRLTLLAGLVVVSLAGDFWLQPKLKKLHTTKYSVEAAPETREAAAQSFRAWHGASQMVNLLMLVGLTVYLWRLTNPPDEPRFLNTAKFRG